MRIITGAISHETSTFTPVPTTWADYRDHFGYLRGAEILEKFRGTNTPIGGFIEGAEAHIRQGGLHVLLVTQREQPFDTAFARTLGLDPRQMRYLGLKSAAHFRAAFEPWAGAIYVVSEPGVHSADTGTLHYHRLGRKLYPFDEPHRGKTD
jgi:microcystin degradation protein MlrC